MEVTRWQAAEFGSVRPASAWVGLSMPGAPVPGCGKTLHRRSTVNAKRDMTDRLSKWIGQPSFRHTFAGVAKEVGIDETSGRKLFRDPINDWDA